MCITGEEKKKKEEEERAGTYLFRFSHTTVQCVFEDVFVGEDEFSLRNFEFLILWGGAIEKGG